MKHPYTLQLAYCIDLIDGRNYINVYSGGCSRLGRLLSNFAYTPFTYRKKDYASVEGFWYSHVTGKDLSKLHGYEAKRAGREHARIKGEPSEKTLLLVYLAKLKYNPDIARLLQTNKLPFAHHYVFGGQKVSADKYLWTADLWRQITDGLHTGRIIL